MTPVLSFSLPASRAVRADPDPPSSAPARVPASVVNTGPSPLMWLCSSSSSPPSPRSSAAAPWLSIPDHAAFHLPGFHSFVRLGHSSYKVVYKAQRSPVPHPASPSLVSSTPPHSLIPSAPCSPFSPTTAPTPTPVTVLASSAAYRSDAEYVLHFTVQCDRGTERLGPPPHSHLMLFARQYAAIAELRQRGAAGLVQPIELLEVTLPAMHLTSDTTTATVSAAASEPATAPSSASPPLPPAQPHPSPPATSFRTLCCVCEWSPGLPLSLAFSQPRYAAGFPLLEFFPAALSLMSVVSSLHAHHFIQRDMGVCYLTSNNLLYNSARREVRLFFDLAATYSLALAQHDGHSDGALTAALPFLAPEKTGRVSWPVDARSDLYSVGVVLYQMLTAVLPFADLASGGNNDGADELELVHAIISRLPTPPIVLRPTLPPMLSALVMKLLEKNPDNRYQSAQGVEHDLLHMFQPLHDVSRRLALSVPEASSHLTTSFSVPTASPVPPSDPSSSSSSTCSSPTSSPSPLPSPLPPPDSALDLPSLTFPTFQLARGDIPSRLPLSSRLYGREAELATLTSCFNDVQQGRRSLVCVSVSGLSGSGKTSMIRSFCASTLRRCPSVLVLTSKLDQYSRQPFALFKQVVNELIVDVLTQSTAQVAQWTSKIQQSVGASGIGLLLDIFPHCTS